MKIKATATRRGLRPGTTAPQRDGVKLSSSTRQTLPWLSLPAIKHILVPIDFSECSHSALSHAVALALQHGATLTLLNVVDFYLADSMDLRLDYRRLSAELHAHANQQLGQLARLLRRHFGKGLIAETIVGEGRPWMEITGLARQKRMSLIILGTHGHSGLAQALLGSTAERVMRNAPCPVLTVPESQGNFIDVM